MVCKRFEGVACETSQEIGGGLQDQSRDWRVWLVRLVKRLEGVACKTSQEIGGCGL